MSTGAASSREGDAERGRRVRQACAVEMRSRRLCRAAPSVSADRSALSRRGGCACSRGRSTSALRVRRRPARARATSVKPVALVDDDVRASRRSPPAAPGSREREQRDEVRHRAGGTEERGLLAEQRRAAALELVDARPRGPSASPPTSRRSAARRSPTAGRSRSRCALEVPPGARARVLAVGDDGRRRSRRRGRRPARRRAAARASSRRRAGRGRARRGRPQGLPAARLDRARSGAPACSSSCGSPPRAAACRASPT